MVQAMDGQILYSNANAAVKKNTAAEAKTPITPTAAQVVQDLEQNLAETKADSQQLQELSELVNGRKLQFSVNKELKTVVVTVVDSNTNQVLKEIPSEDIQKLKLRIRKAIGNLYDNLA
jgi:flagellar protein FlaG